MTRWSTPATGRARPLAANEPPTRFCKGCDLMPPSVLSAIEAFLRRHNLRNQLIVVAVSGGADSLALLHGLLALRQPFGLRLHAAHLNHQLRGRESELDAEHVE